MVADQRHAERNAGFRGVSYRSRNARIGHRRDDVGLDRMLARQQSSEALAALVHPAAKDQAVGARKINVFEDAVLMRFSCAKRMDSTPPFEIRTISPGSISRTYSASIKSNAQVSEAATHAPFSRPMESGRKPRGSRIA